MATTLRNDAKKQIIKILHSQSYHKYASLVSMFDIYLTDDPEVVGYMVPDKAKIVLNKDLDIYQVSVIVRHEVLHEYLTHAIREQKFNAAHPELSPDHELMNVAADMEISNRGYTSADKANIRAIRLHGQKLKGLVTEDHDPSWVTLSFEQMYEKLLQERKQLMNKIEDLIKQQKSVSQQELEDLEDQAQQAASSSTQQPSDENFSSGKQVSKPQQSNTDNSENDAATSGAKSDPEEEEGNAAVNDGENTDRRDSAELVNEIEELQQQQANIENSSDNTPFHNPAEVDALADIRARAEEIKRLLSDDSFMGGVAQETSNAVRQDRIKRERVKANANSSYAAGSAGGLSNFKLDLKRFVSSLEGDVRERSYKTFDPRYEGSGYVMPGRSRVTKQTIPKINIYWDTSGSFSKPQKTAGARAAIDAIQGYVKRGLIQTYTYYHCDDVYTTPHTGGNNGNNVIKHILDTKPDNVIIITDGDLSDTTISAVVPGAVWMLFYDYTSEGLIKHLKGRKQSKWYMIDYKS